MECLTVGVLEECRPRNPGAWSTVFDPVKLAVKLRGGDSVKLRGGELAVKLAVKIAVKLAVKPYVVDMISVVEQIKGRQFPTSSSSSSPSSPPSSPTSRR
jgi:hypothetical protein